MKDDKEVNETGSEVTLPFETKKFGVDISSSHEVGVEFGTVITWGGSVDLDKAKEFYDSVKDPGPPPGPPTPGPPPQ